MILSETGAQFTVQLKGVTFSHPSTALFHTFSHTFESGRIIGLFGRNGCGKSTLLKLIAKLHEPDTGEITTDVCRARNQVGFLFQSAQESLFPWLNVRWNLRFAAWQTGRNAVRTLVEQTMREWKIDDLASRFPRWLSGGEAQRVALARMLVTDPNVVLLDEPFASLDFITRMNLIKFARSKLASADRVVIVVGHHLDDLIHLADVITVLRTTNGFTGVAGSVVVDRVEGRPKKPIQDLTDEVLRLANESPPAETYNEEIS